MKKAIIFYAILIISVPVFGQTVKEDFAGWANVTSVSGTGPYVITINSFLGNARKFGDTWLISDMAAGDILWGGNCSRFIVTSRAGFAITVTDPDPGDAIIPVASERIGFVRETAINGYAIAPIPQFGDGNAGAVAGVTSVSAGCIIAHYNKNQQLATLAAKEITYYSGSGTPGFTPVSGDPLLARNGIGDIYKYNGSAWVAVTPATVTATVGGSFPAYNTLERVTAATSDAARAIATTSTGLPFVWMHGAGAATGTIIIK